MFLKSKVKAPMLPVVDSNKNRTVTGEDGEAVNTESEGNRTGLAVSYPELIFLLEHICHSLDKIHAQLAEITGEDDLL